MKWYFILLIVIGSTCLFLFMFTYFCFYLAFYVKRKKKVDKEKIETPKGKIYEPYKEKMIKWIKEMRTYPHTHHYITSFDGLKLHASYYEKQKGGIIEIMFPGYRGSAERDLAGGIARAFKINHNVLMVDQRTSCDSEGNVVTFGIKERFDCVKWAKYVVENIDPDAKIILTGVSMGAATVILASELDLPKNVIGILADCGFSSQKAIISKVIKQIHLPAKIFYPFVKLGAKIFGKFNIEERAPIDAAKNTNLPIIFFHGDEDNFVPHHMSIDMYNSKKDKKEILIVPKAGHGLAYILNPPVYLEKLINFFEK
ncbi:MAG: alpha/beta hydrolase [Bacilli bacterium]|nr:alpha/beta hydrolase [Bacilli bacterium]